MKKHFLLLMMAFMSMTAWAQIDISTFAIRVSAGYYGGTAPVITVYDTEIGAGTTLVQGTDYTWNGKFYSDAACTTEAGAFADLLPGGPYYVKVLGTDAYTGEKIGSCSIKKGQIKGLAITIPGKTYGAENPTPSVDASGVTGFKSPDTWSSVFGSSTITYTLASENVGTQVATFDALSTDLYEVVFPTTPVTCTISKKALTAEMVITPASGESVYTAAAQTPSVVVKDGTTTLSSVEGKDYTVKTYSNVGLTSETAAINVGTYYVGIVGGGNYSTSAPIPAGSFEITQATLTAMAVDQEKNYNASPALPKTAWSATATESAMTIVGFLGTDGPSAISTKPTASVVSAKADAGTYDITLSGGASTNYKFNYVPATFTIKKLPLTITANNDSKLFGAADPSPFTYTMVGALSSEVTEIQALIDHTSAATETATKSNGDIKVTRSNATVNDKGVYEGVLVVSYNNTAVSVLRNYTVTTAAGKFTIAGGQIYITVLPQTIEYGDDEPNWASPEAGKDYIVTGLSGEDKLKKAPTLSRATPTVKNKGTYAVTAAGAEAPEGYAGITYVPSTFTITAKQLVVTPQVQTLKVGQTVAALDQALFTISETTKLATGDKASEIIQLAFATGTGAPAVDTDGKLTTAKPYANGIVASVKTGVTNYTIKTPATYGKLIVVDPAATIVLNRPVKDDFADAQKNNAANVIATAAADKYTAAEAAAINAGLDGAISTSTSLTAAQATKLNGISGVSKTTYAAGENPTGADAILYNATLTGAVSTSTVEPKDVTFGDFELAKERWYSLTLPFATSVAELSSAFGYAVVDIFDVNSNISNDVKFSLWMGDLPANEPFIFKVYKDMNMNEATFSGKTIVNSDDLSLTDVTGNKFIGTYSGINGFEPGKKYFFSVKDGDIKRCGSSTYLYPLAAYIETVEVMDGMSAAPRILIEEPDGTTTAINPISVENKQDAEGWYNINGMKLNNAPTQKGIYIKNGKKVIVK